jgi:hypothetical protein
MKFTPDYYKSLPHLDSKTFVTEGNRYVTEAIFWELADGQNRKDLYYWTLSEREKEREGAWIPSAHNAVVFANDEYDAAMKVVGSWQLWLRIKQNKRIWEGMKGICPGLGAALEEQKMRKASEAIKQMNLAALDGNVAAQKYIYDLNKSSKTAKKRAESATSKTKAEDNVEYLLNKVKP